MGSYNEVLKEFQKNFFSTFAGLNSDNDSGKSLEDEIVKRDKKYTELLQNYLSITKIRNTVKEIHKWIFFWLVIIACGVVIYLVCKTLNHLLASEDYSVILQSIPIFITAIVSCVTAVIAIPLAITNFLFNTKEDDNIAGIIQHMQEHDMAGITLLKERFGKNKSRKEDEPTTK